MANTVIALKKSGTPSAIPVDLANGEIAINYADGKIFYKSAAGSIQEISGGGGGGGNAFGTVNANGTLIVSDTTGDVFSLVPGPGITIVGDAINDSITISSVADVSLPYDTANAAYNQANSATTIGSAAFVKANSADSTAIASYDQSNTNSTIITASFNKANDSYTVAVAAFDKANTANYYAYLVDSNTSAAFFQANNASLIANSAYDSSNLNQTITITAFDKANAANVLAYDTGIGANAFASATIAGANTAVGTGANAYADIVGSSANSYLLSVISGANTAVGAGANSYADIVGNSANAYSDIVGSSANSYADVVGSSSNSYLLSVIAGANTDVGAGANTVGSAAFDKANNAETIAIAAYTNSNTKLATTGGTITGDLAIVGNLAISGNTSYINVVDYRVEDPLLYLAGNNYISDIVDIGFIGNYVNSTGSNVHTGLFRNHEDKEYYLFYGYDAEPENNHIDPQGNNFTLAVLNADLKTSNLVLGGQNTITWLTAAYDKANAANLLAYDTGIGANTFTSATIAGANTAVGTGANAYADIVGSSANTHLLNILNGANTITLAAFDKANSANVVASSAYDSSNLNQTIIINAYDKANAANILAKNAYDYANTLITGGASVTVSNTAPTSPASGDLWWNSEYGRLFVYYTDDDSSQWVDASPSMDINYFNSIVSGVYDTANSANAIAIAAYEKADNVFSQFFVANGAQTTFALSNNVSQQNNSIVSVDGLLQIPGLHYTISGTNLTFTSNPLNKSNIEVRVFSTVSRILGTTNNDVTIYVSDLYSYVNTVGVMANAFASATIAGANTAVGAGANAFTSATIAGANTAVGAGANAFTSATIAGANTAVGAGANAFTSATIAGANTAVGAGANTVSVAAFDKANSALANTSGASFEGNLNLPKGNIIIGSASTSYNITVNGIEVGFRNIPWSGGADKTSTYTLAKGDVGEFVSIGANDVIIIPTATFSAGDIISMFNNTGNTVNITCNAVTTYIGGNNTTRTRVSLATRGICTAFFYSSNVCIITGNIT